MILGFWNTSVTPFRYLSFFSTINDYLAIFYKNLQCCVQSEFSPSFDFLQKISSMCRSYFIYHIPYYVIGMCQSYSLRKCALWKLGTIVWPFLSSIWRTNILRKFPFSSAAWRRRHTGCFYLENKPNVASQRVRLFFWLGKMELIMAILSRKCKCRFVPLIPGHSSHPHHPNLFDSQKCKWEKKKSVHHKP